MARLSHHLGLKNAGESLTQMPWEMALPSSDWGPESSSTWEQGDDSTLHSKGRDTPQPGGRKHPRDLVVHKQFSKLTQRLEVLIWEPSTDRQEHPAVCSRRMCEGGRAGTREEITGSHPGRQCCHLQSTTGNPGRMPHCWDKMEPGSWASHRRTVESRAHASCCPSPPHREPSPQGSALSPAGGA